MVYDEKMADEKTCVSVYLADICGGDSICQLLSFILCINPPHPAISSIEVGIMRGWWLSFLSFDVGLYCLIICSSLVVNGCDDGYHLYYHHATISPSPYPRQWNEWVYVGSVAGLEK